MDNAAKLLQQWHAALLKLLEHTRVNYCATFGHVAELLSQAAAKIRRKPDSGLLHMRRLKQLLHWHNVYELDDKHSIRLAAKL